MIFLDALQYPFQDKSWFSKIIVIALVLLIPFVGGLILAGYGIRVINNLLNNIRDLPEVNDFGGDLSKGFMVFLGSLIYGFPALILFCLMVVIASAAGDSGSTLVFCCFYVFIIAYAIIVAPAIYSAMARYAVTGDFAAFTDVPGRFQDVMANTGAVINLYLNLFLYSLVLSVLVPLGFVLCIIPGLIIIVGSNIGQYYFVADWARNIGIVGQGAGIRY